MTSPAPDPVTQEQESLDTTQELTSESTAADQQFERMAELVAEKVMSQIKPTVDETLTHTRGLQGRLDRGLQSLEENQVARAAQTERSKQLREQLDQLPEEQRPVFQALIEETEARAKEVQELRQAQPAEDPNAVVRQAAERYVREEWGLDPSDSRIDYNALTNSDNGLNDQERRRQFNTSLRLVMQSVAAAPPAAEVRQDVSPPVNGTPAASGSADTADGLRDLFIQGRISREDYEQRTSQAGVRI